MNYREIVFVTLTVGIYGALTWWQPCLTTLCKTTSFPNWLNKIVYSVPVPFAEKFILALILMIPLIVFTDGMRPIITTVLLAPLLTVIVKYAPKWEATRAFFLSTLFDYAFVAIALATSSSLILVIRWMTRR